MPWLVVIVIWCFFHQYHLAIKGALAILDGFSWPSIGGDELQTKYFSALATITNVWRGVGIQRKMIALAVELYDDSVAALFEKLPGRCLRGRWGSVDEVEGLYIKMRRYIGPLFAALFGANGEKLNKKRIKRALWGPCLRIFMHDDCMTQLSPRPFSFETEAPELLYRKRISICYCFRGRTEIGLRHSKKKYQG